MFFRKSMERNLSLQGSWLTVCQRQASLDYFVSEDSRCGATKAANSGVGERVFQRHGRWKSVSAKDGYAM